MSGFRVCCVFDLFVFLGPTCKSMLEKEGKGIFPLNERIVEDLDFGMAMSDFLMIFPLDSSTVILLSLLLSDLVVYRRDFRLYFRWFFVVNYL